MSVLIYGIFLTLTCLAMVLWPRRKARAVEQRITEGVDRFFEEQRTYRAYPSARDPKRIRLMAAIGTVGGLIVFAMAIYRG